MVIAPDAPLETEVFGVTYERYALQKLCARLVRQLDLHSVIEWPAGGAKAMPSLYSLGFALEGCRVALVNANPEAECFWYRLGLAHRLTLMDEADLERIAVRDQRWDLCWNFAALATSEDAETHIRQMAMVSRKWLLFVGVNRYNVGFPIHRAVHRHFQIPWTHGDLRFFSPFATMALFQQLGFKDIHWGILDAPPWPDSLGFRDVRLHRQGEGSKRWDSPYLHFLMTGRFSYWMRAVYLLERLPLPNWAKLPYAHLFYVYARVNDAGVAAPSGAD